MLPETSSGSSFWRKGRGVVGAGSKVCPMQCLHDNANVSCPCRNHEADMSSLNFAHQSVLKSIRKHVVHSLTDAILNFLTSLFLTFSYHLKNVAISVQLFSPLHLHSDTIRRTSVVSETPLLLPLCHDGNLPFTTISFLSQVVLIKSNTLTLLNFSLSIHSIILIN